MRNNTDFHAYVRATAGRAERVFKGCGQFQPMWHVVLKNGEDCVLPSPHPDKDMAVAMMKAFFQTNPTQRYVFIGEAWIRVHKTRGDADKQAREWAARHWLGQHPGYTEIMFFSAEDAQLGTLQAMRTITRTKRSKPQLGPLTFMDGGASLMGRFIGLLPQEGALQ